MEEIFRTIIKDPVEAEWVEKNIGLPIFYLELIRAGTKGYNLMHQQSAIFVKPTYPEFSGEIGHTSLDILFLRPSDIHYHLDENEYIKVLNGTGELWVGREKKSLFPGIEERIEVNTPHAFIPDKGESLEIHLECKGNIDVEKKEVTVRRFDQYKTWEDYLSAIKEKQKGLF